MRETVDTLLRVWNFEFHSSVDVDIEWLDAVPGRVPTLEEKLPGCAFHPRCSFAQTLCAESLPKLATINSQHVARCHFAGELEL